MNKKQLTVLIIIAMVVLGGILAWGLIEKEKLSQEQEEREEVFSLSAIVASVDAENNCLMVKPAVQGKEIKIVLSETSQLIKLEFPFDPQNPPEGATFTPEQTVVGISDFQEGDSIFIKSKEDITGKNEIGNIDFIHILP